MLSYPEIRGDILEKLAVDDTRLGEALSMLNREARKCLENEAWSEIPAYCELARKFCDELWINGVDPGHAEAVFRAYEGISHLCQAEKKAGEPEESTELAKAIDYLEKSRQSFSGYNDQWNEILLDLNLGRLYRSQNKLNEALLAFERSCTFSNLNGLSDKTRKEVLKTVRKEIAETRRLFDGQKLLAPHAPEKLLPPMQPKVAPLRVLPIIDEIAAGTEKPVSDDDVIGYIQQIDESEFMFEGQALEVQLLGKSRVTFSPAYDYVAVQVSGDSMDEAGISPNDYVILQKEKAGVLPLQPYPGNIVAVVFRDEDDKATLKRFYFDWSSGSVTLKPESSNPEHKPRVLRPEVFAGDNPSVAIVGIVMAVLKPQPVLKPRPRIEVQQRRFTDIRFPEQCRINQPVHLSIQLTVDSMTRGGREGQAELIVFVSADSFEVDRRWRELSVPFGQDSERVGFELIGQRLGTQIIEVEFFRGTARVGYTVVETEVVDGDTCGQDKYHSYESPDDQKLLSAQKQPTAIATVIASWQIEKGIDYWVMMDTRPEDGGFVSLPSSEDAVVKFWEELSGLLGEVVPLAGLPTDKQDSIWLAIEGFGQDLYQRLLPAELQSHSSKWEPDSVVRIATNEQWIPWELIHDGTDFWGDKFILARIHKKPNRRPLSASDKTVERYDSTQLRKVVNIIGGQLKPSRIVQQVKNLFDALRVKIPTVEDIEEATLAKVLESIANADLIHFTCHGRTTALQPCLQLADNLSRMYRLTPTDLQTLKEPLTDSIIFTNACTSGDITFFLGELRNFGWEFYKKGAAACIGTLGLVPTEYAVAFAERFYERLLAGETIGESLRYAKSEAERENPFWLLYTLYGDPFARKYVQS